MVDIKITSNKGFTILTLGDETINMTNKEFQVLKDTIKANTPEEYSKQLKIQIKKLFNNG